MEYLPLILDLAMVAALLIYILIDSKRGFFKAIAALVVLAASLIVAGIFTPKVAQFIDDKFMHSTVTEKVGEFFESVTSADKDKPDELQKKVENDDTEVEQLLEKFGTTSKKLLEDIGKKFKDTVGDFTEKAISTISDPLSMAISKALAFIALFLVTTLVTTIVMNLFDAVFSGKTLSRFNAFMGGIVGFLKGAVLVFAVCYVLCHMWPAISKLSGADNNVIEKTHIVKYIGLYEQSEVE